MTKKLFNLFGLKWDPFSPEVPAEGLFITKAFENFAWRVENALLTTGGFGSITGEPGTGKSVSMRLLAERLAKLPDVRVGVLTHPSSHLADFYREMGELFSVPLRPHNRWCGFKALRECWQAHIESTLTRPVLLIDEAQELSSAVLSELRLLASTHFDSRIILTVLLAGDSRLAARLETQELAPVASRIRTRLLLEAQPSDELHECLRHLLASAGNSRLMTKELMDTVCDHAAGNVRALTNLASELLTVGARAEVSQLDEKLFLELTANSHPVRATRKAIAPRRH